MFERTRREGRTRTSPRIIPGNGRIQSRPRTPAGPPQTTQILPAIDASALTQKLPRVNPATLPAVYPHTDPVPATALAGTLPLPGGYLPLPPSARHADPAAWHARTHVEDNDLEPQTRGQHVLNELKSLPEPAEELAAAERRVVSAMVTGVPQVKNPAMRLAVRMFREARDMAREREARCAEDEARLQAADDRIKAFAERWAHDNAHWDRVAQVLKAKETASDAGQLTTVYEADGTAAALYKVDELSHVIVERARAKAGVR